MCPAEPGEKAKSHGIGISAPWARESPSQARSIAQSITLLLPAAGTEPGLRGKKEVISLCTAFSPLPEPAQVAGISRGGDAASELIFHRPNSCDAYGGCQRSSTARANQMGKAAVA